MIKVHFYEVGEGGGGGGGGGENCKKNPQKTQSPTAWMLFKRTQIGVNQNLS